MYSNFQLLISIQSSGAVSLLALNNKIADPDQLIYSYSFQKGAKNFEKIMLTWYFLGKNLIVRLYSQSTWHSW